MIRQFRFAVGPLLVAVLVVGGCNWAGSDRVPLSGFVLEGSRPVLSDGSLTLLPEAGNSAPAVTTEITEGRYEFDRRNGPRPGRYEAIVALFDAELLSSNEEAADKFDEVDPDDTGEMRRPIEVPAESPWAVDIQLR